MSGKFRTQLKIIYISASVALKRESQPLSSALSSAFDFKSHFCKQCGPRSDCCFRSSLIWVHKRSSLICVEEQSDLGPQKEQSDLGPHCLPVCKNRFEKFARIFSRRHKQTTFSDAFFLAL